jgi:hypothetical protein
MRTTQGLVEPSLAGSPSSLPISVNPMEITGQQQLMAGEKDCISYDYSQGDTLWISYSN